MRPVGTASELEKRRKDAIRRVRAGERVIEIARDLGVSKVAIYNWKHAAEEGGLRALNAIPQHVPESRMSDSQRRKLKFMLLRGAAAWGYPTDLWTCARIAEVIQAEFGIQYNIGHLGRILHTMGFSCQKPVTYARERDPKTADHFRTASWKRVKKGRKSRS